MTPEQIIADLKITPHAEPASVYVCRWPKHWGWAIITLHDATGFFGIVSDHGSWSYIWHPSNIGQPSLHHFLAQADWHYVAKKCRPDNLEKPDPDETCRFHQREICERRREGRLSKEVARERWDEVKDWTNNGMEYSVLPDWIDAYDAVSVSLTGESRAFRDIVWPVAQRAIREAIARREALQRGRVIPSRYPLSFGATKVTISDRSVVFVLDDGERDERVSVALDGREAGSFEGDREECEIWAAGWIQGVIAMGGQSEMRGVAWALAAVRQEMDETGPINVAHLDALVASGILAPEQVCALAREKETT